MNTVQALPLRGKFFVEHRNAAGKLIGLYRIPNGITDDGMAFLLDCMFSTGVQSDPWYIGLIDSAGFVGEADADTMAAHAGWSEFTDYAGARKAWTVGAAAGRAASNAATVDFTISAAGDVEGIFVTDQLAGVLDILWATALFSSSISVAIADVLKITYTVSG